MLSALRKAAIPAAAGSAVAAIMLATGSVAIDATPLALLLKYWYIYVPAVLIPTTFTFAHVMVNNWLASGDPQKRL